MRVFPVIAIVACIFSCSPKKTLPVFDFSVVQRTLADGKPATDTAGKVIFDTLYFRVPSFTLFNQDAQPVNEMLFENKVSVVDFFFTSCPTICPKMKQQMRRVHEHFTDEPRVQLFSFTIDPRRDSTAKLKSFHDKLQLKNNRWQFITGEKNTLLMVSRAFMAPVREDPRLPGGFDHSGKFVLVDGKGMFRGFYNGTTDTGTTRLIEDMEWLLTHE